MLKGLFTAFPAILAFHIFLLKSNLLQGSMDSLVDYGVCGVPIAEIRLVLVHSFP